MLDFSKVEAGKLEVEHDLFDIEKVLDNVPRWSRRAQRQGLELVFRPGGRRAALCGGRRAARGARC